MLSCPRCGGELPTGAHRCEQCGHVLAFSPLPDVAVAPASARRLVGGLGCVVLAVLLALLSIVVVFGLLLGGLVGAAGRA